MPQKKPMTPTEMISNLEMLKARLLAPPKSAEEWAVIGATLSKLKIEAHKHEGDLSQAQDRKIARR